MKKVISCILMLSLLLSPSFSVFASEAPIDANEKASFQCNGHGEYIMTTATVNQNMNVNDTTTAGNVVTAIELSEGGIYKLDNNKYLTLAYGNTYLLTEKINVDTNDFSSNKDNFDKYHISENLRNDMKMVIDAQNELGNKDFSIEVFVPYETVDEIQPLADEPLGTTYYNYVYQGTTYRMKDYSVKYGGLMSGSIKKIGTNSLPLAKSFVNFVVSVASGSNVIVGAFGSALSAYDVYKNAIGPVVTGSSDDEISTNLFYARILKETYDQDPVSGDYPNAGCVSHKVWLNKHDTYQAYAKTARSFLISPSLNKELFSPNFKNPAPVAIENGISSTQVDFPLTTKIYNTTVRLMGF